MKDQNGTESDALVKIEDSGTEDVWCTVQDLDTLFDTCVKRWGSNWDLNKVCTAITECDFD
jgi:hypothetical protein